MPAIKKSVSFDEKSIEIVENFPSRYGVDEFSTKVQEIIQDYHLLLSRAKREVEGLFSEAEWNYLRDMLNSAILTPDLPLKTVLVAEIEDADKYDNLGQKWGVDPKKLAEKIQGLTEFQAYAAVKLTDEFWENEKQ